MEVSNNKLCPSSTGTEGASILGLVQGNHTVALLPEPLPITKDFIEKAQTHGSLEKRFRFVNKCVKSGCSQWTGSNCGVIELLIKANENMKLDASLRACNIRKNCRWYNEHGSRACHVCVYVVTDNLDANSIQEIPNPFRNKY